MRRMAVLLFVLVLACKEKPQAVETNTIGNATDRSPVTGTSGTGEPPVTGTRAIAVTGTEVVHGTKTETTSTLVAPTTTTAAVATPTETTATVQTMTGARTSQKKKH